MSIAKAFASTTKKGHAIFTDSERNSGSGRFTRTLRGQPSIRTTWTRTKMPGLSSPIIVWERLRRATWTSRPVQNALSLEHLMELLGSFYHIFLFSHPSLFHFLHDIVIYLSGTSFYRLIVKSCKFNIGVLNAVHAVPIIL